MWWRHFFQIIQACESIVMQTELIKTIDEVILRASSIHILVQAAIWCAWWLQEGPCLHGGLMLLLYGLHVTLESGLRWSGWGFFCFKFIPCVTCIILVEIVCWCMLDSTNWDSRCSPLTISTCFQPQSWAQIPLARHWGNCVRWCGGSIGQRSPKVV